MGKRSKTKPSFYERMRRRFAGFLRRLLRVRVSGIENLPEGGCLLCCNHIDYPDALVLASAIPREICFLAKKELFHVPLVSGILKRAGAIAISRDSADVDAIRKAVDSAKAGHIVAVYPQGHRRKGKNPWNTEIKYGIAMMAYRSGVPVVPVCLRMKHEKYAPFRPIQLLIGEPIQFPFPPSSPGKAVFETATKVYFRATCALGGYLPDALPEGGTGCP